MAQYNLLDIYNNLTDIRIKADVTDDLINYMNTGDIQAYNNFLEKIDDIEFKQKPIKKAK